MVSTRRRVTFAVASLYNARNYRSFENDMRSFPTAEAVTTISATTAHRRSTYRLNQRFKPSSKVLPRTKSILQPASGKFLARNTTLPLRYSVVEYILSLLAICQELARTDEAISDTTVVCHFLFEPYHYLSILSSAFPTTNIRGRSYVRAR